MFFCFLLLHFVSVSFFSMLFLPLSSAPAAMLILACCMVARNNRAKDEAPRPQGSNQKKSAGTGALSNGTEMTARNKANSNGGGGGKGGGGGGEQAGIQAGAQAMKASKAVHHGGDTAIEISQNGAQSSILLLSSSEDEDSTSSTSANSSSAEDSEQEDKEASSSGVESTPPSSVRSSVS